MSSIGYRLVQLRKQKGLSQEEIAAKLKVSQPAYHKWETGITKPTRDHINKICDFFGIDEEELLKEESLSFNGNTINDSTIFNSSNSTISNVHMYPPELMDKLVKNQDLITKTLLAQNKLMETFMDNIKSNK